LEFHQAVGMPKITKFFHTDSTLQDSLAFSANTVSN